MSCSSCRSRCGSRFRCIIRTPRCWRNCKRSSLAAPGKGKLLLDLEEPGEFCAVLEPQGVTVSADRLFIDRVEELVGRGGVRVIG